MCVWLLGRTILYSPILAIPPFLWSACRVHFNVIFAHGLGACLLFSQPPHSPISVVTRWSVHFQMSSLLSSPNSIHIIPFVALVSLNPLPVLFLQPQRYDISVVGYIFECRLCSARPTLYILSPSSTRLNNYKMTSKQI